MFVNEIRFDIVEIIISNEMVHKLICINPSFYLKQFEAFHAMSRGIWELSYIKTLTLTLQNLDQ